MLAHGAPTYEGLQPIGSNGFAHTYRAWAGGRDATVVLKVYDPALDEAGAARFLADLEAFGDVEHPALAPVLEGGLTDDGRAYVVRHRLTAEPLGTGGDAAGTGLEELRVVAAIVAEALAALHDHGLAHGAITPDNVLVVGGPDPLRAWLTDPLPSSIAALRPEGFRRDPAFVAPEVLELGRPSPAGDVYSFAATISAALGRVAAPPGLHELLGACLQSRPGDRPSATTLAEGLRPHSPTLRRPGPTADGPVPLAGSTPEVLRRAVRPGDLAPTDLSSLYRDGRRRRSEGRVRSRPASWESSRWAVAGTIAGAALVGLGILVAPDVLADRSSPPSTRRATDAVRVAERTTDAPTSDPGPATTSAAPLPESLVVTAAALVAGPRDQAQLKVAIDATRPGAGPAGALVALVGRTGPFSPPPGLDVAARTLPFTPTELGVAATLGQPAVTALPANPDGLSEEFSGPDGQTRATFASRAGVPVFYVPNGSELLGVGVVDDAGTLRAFASAADWPELAPANAF